MMAHAARVHVATHAKHARVNASLHAKMALSILRWSGERIQRMTVEIERKFLLANADWKREVVESEHLRDGLIARFGDGKVRVRLTESNAWLTIKGPRKGISRPEFEYEIPRADAEHMLRTLCQGDPVLEKVR